MEYSLKKKKNISLILILLFWVLQSCGSLKIPTIYDAQNYGAKEVFVDGKARKLRQSRHKIPHERHWISDKYLKRYGSLDVMLEKSNTTSFLVMKNGEILYENYFNRINPGDLTQIFSVTKVVTTSILGIALQEGLIKSLHQPVSDFIPSFQTEGLNEITLFHLAQMQSGLAYDEYKKIFQTLKFYHQKDINQTLQLPKLRQTPGSTFKYKSIDTQLLGFCIEQAVGIPFLDYINKKLFSKLGFQDPVYWSVDSRESGQIKYYGGLNISARDLAKFGQLFLNNGRVGEKQVLSPMTLSFCRDSNCRNGEDTYCNGWWYDLWDVQTDIFFGAGFKGQILMIDKTDDVVIVRLGENKGGIKWYEMLKNLSKEIGKQSSESQSGFIANKD